METLVERAERLGVATATVSEMLDELERLHGEVEGADVLHDAEKMLHSRTKAMVGDLARLVTRLARQLAKAAPDNELPEMAMDFLSRNNLHGSPLRKVGDGDTAPGDAFPQAHRLALELECLLLSTTDTAAVSKWWDSANDALEQWREFCREETHNAKVTGAAPTKGE